MIRVNLLETTKHAGAENPNAALRRDAGRSLFAWTRLLVVFACGLSETAVTGGTCSGEQRSSAAPFRGPEGQPATGGGKSQATWSGSARRRACGNGCR